MTDAQIGDVDLLPGEREIKAWRAQTATWGPWVSGGVLNLTSLRLIWTRKGFNFVPGSSVTVGLEQIETCVGDDGFSRHRVVLTLADGSERTFHMLIGADGIKVAEYINEVRRRRGLLDG